MKWIVERDCLLKPLQMLIAPISSRPVLPILSHILLDISDQRLTLISTDLEIEMKTSLTLIEQTNDGKITVPAKKLLDICKTLPNGSKLTMELHENRFLIAEAQNRFSLVTLPAIDYPNLETWDRIAMISVAQNKLKQQLESVQFSMANQDVRYYLNGILFEINNNELTVVATDGHRLGINKMPLTQPIANCSFILPRKSVIELIKLLSNQDAMMQIELGQNHVRFHFEQFIFTSKLIDGRYPDYRRVLPANPDKILYCNRESLKKALIQVAILSNDKFKGVRFLLNQNHLKMTANNQEREEAEVNLTVDFKHSALEIGFNIQYLMEVLNYLSCETVCFLMSDSIASVQIQNPEDTQLIYIIMPMRL